MFYLAWFLPMKPMKSTQEVMNRNTEILPSLTNCVSDVYYLSVSFPGFPWNFPGFSYRRRFYVVFQNNVFHLLTVN